MSQQSKNIEKEAQNKAIIQKSIGAYLNKLIVKPVQQKMLKSLLCIFALFALVLARSNMRVYFDNKVASYDRNGPKYYGLVPIQCSGGSGDYKFQITNLPSGWKAQNNVISIPAISSVNGEFVINVKVTDSVGNVLAENIKLVVNGINVRLDSLNTGANNNTQRNGLVQDNAEIPKYIPVTNIVSAASNPSISALYQNYPGIQNLQQGNRTANSVLYKTPSVVGPPATPNLTPTLINNAQIPYNSARDAKPITIDDVKRNAAFNRQLNANKAVANLVAIIQQLTANVNAAQIGSQSADNTRKNLEVTNLDCNSKIYDHSNNLTKIRNAMDQKKALINQTNDKIANLAPIISELTSLLNNLVAKRTEIQRTRSPNAQKLIDLEKLQKDCNSITTNYETKIDDLKSQIDGLKFDIRSTKDDTSSAPGAISLIDQQIPIIDSKINDILNQLENAKKEKANLLQDKLKHQKTIDDSNKKVRDLQRKIDDLQSRIPNLVIQSESQITKCARFTTQIDNLRSEITQQQDSFRDLMDKIRNQEQLIGSKKDEQKRLRESIAKLPSQIIALQQQSSRVQESIRRQFYICSNVGENMKKNSEVMDAWKNKYQKEYASLQEANINLEKARAEKDLADQAVTEIIASSANVLPYAIVPNGNSKVNGGTPAGNNPSGSPFGSVTEKNQVIPGSAVAVGDLSNYLSQAYSAGVDPAKPATVTTLYPLSQATAQAIVGANRSGVFNADGTFTQGVLTGAVGGGTLPVTSLAKFSCNLTKDPIQGKGQVLEVMPGKVIVASSDGLRITLDVAQCSKLLSTKENLLLQPKTPVLFKGNRTSNNSIQLQSLTCF